MGEGFQALDIILFAALAAFLVFRLRSVLGRRTGNEPRQPKDAQKDSRKDSQKDSGTGPSRDAEPDDNVIEMPGRGARDDSAEAAFEAADSDDQLSAGLTQIRIADPNFDPAEFASGAQSAFEMVVQAFADGDTKMLRNLLNDEVFENFSNAIKEREEAGETLETTLIGIKSSDIIEARLDGRMAFVVLKFVSDQVNVTKNKDDAVIDGDPNYVTTITDLWTFARNTRARDPNWTLVETRSPN
jgi:predicted lipid-binding transport protein (Tim44 family)